MPAWPVPEVEVAPRAVDRAGVSLAWAENPVCQVLPFAFRTTTVVVSAGWDLSPSSPSPAGVGAAEGSARCWDPRWGFRLSTGCPVHRRVCADFCLGRPPAPALLTCLCPLLAVYFWGRLPPGLWWQSYHFLVILLLIQLS